MNRSGTAVIAAISVASCFSPFGTKALAGYQGVAVVAKSGGQYTDPVDAMNKIQEWCPTLSSVKPRCLLKIMPGVYSLGTRTLKMREAVDIEGAGETMTLLSGKAATGTGSGTNVTTGLVVGASNAEIRFLGISATDEPAVFNNNASPLLTHLAISATVSEPFDGIYGIYNVASSPRITDVGIYVTGGDRSIGISNANASAPRMQHVRVSAKNAGSDIIGILNKDSSPEMVDMSVTVHDASYCEGVHNENSSAKMKDVDVAVNRCITRIETISNVSSSPIMTDVNALAEGAEGCVAIQNRSASSPVMTNVTASASDCGQAIAIDNRQSAPVMINVTAKATPPSFNAPVAIFNDDSPAVLSNVIATASGEGGGFGDVGGVAMKNVTFTGKTFKVLVDRSTFSGVSSLFSDKTVSLQIGGAKLDGPVRAAGPINCVNSYNGEYLPLNNVCQ